MHVDNETALAQTSVVEIIIAHEYKDDSIKIIITDLTTKSALKKRDNIEKSIDSETMLLAILTSSIISFCLICLNHYYEP